MGLMPEPYRGAVDACDGLGWSANDHRRVKWANHGGAIDCPMVHRDRAHRRRIDRHDARPCWIVVYLGNSTGHDVVGLARRRGRCERRWPLRYTGRKSAFRQALMPVGGETYRVALDVA